MYRYVSICQWHFVCVAHIGAHVSQHTQTKDECVYVLQHRLGNYNHHPTQTYTVDVRATTHTRRKTHILRYRARPLSSPLLMWPCLSFKVRMFSIFSKHNVYMRTYGRRSSMSDEENASPDVAHICLVCTSRSTNMHHDGNRPHTVQQRLLYKTRHPNSTPHSPHPHLHHVR